MRATLLASAMVVMQSLLRRFDPRLKPIALPMFCLRIRAHVLRRHKPSVVSKHSQLATQMMTISPTGIIAKQIIELAKAGERNPDLLCEGALAKLRGHLHSE